MLVLPPSIFNFKEGYYIIGNLHFGNKKRLKNFQSFKNIKEYNDYLINQWNSVLKYAQVKQVVVLGNFIYDFIILNSIIKNLIADKILLIPGEYDSLFFDETLIYDRTKVIVVPNSIVFDSVNKVCLSPFPIILPDKNKIISICAMDNIETNVTSNIINVNASNYNFKPQNIKDLIKLFKLFKKEGKKNNNE